MINPDSYRTPGKMNKINKTKYKRFESKKTRKSCLDINMKGFLCSCNNREKDCISEAYNILNKYEELMKQENIYQQPKEVDVQDDLSNELFNLKSQKDFKTFQLVESGAKNLLFIKTTLENTVELATAIASDIQKTRIQQSKFLIRLIPIEITCKAYVKDIETAFKTLAEKYFKQESKTFSVAYNHRNNNNLERDEIIKTIANVIMQLRPDNKVDLRLPQLVVVVEVIKGIALLSVIPNYIQYKKFNLLALSEEPLTNLGHSVETNENCSKHS